jgi:hypothetical protein
MGKTAYDESFLLFLHFIMMTLTRVVNRCVSLPIQILINLHMLLAKNLRKSLWRNSLGLLDELHNCSKQALAIFAAV